MAYASGEKRNSLGTPGPPGTNVAASTPCPPSQPRKGTSSRPVLSARSSTSANGGQAGSGPLVASVLGNSFAYHNRTASPGPQRSAASPQHPSSQRSTSASLQRSASSSRQRSSHGQLPGKPFFAAYGLQYSGNGRASGTLGSSTSRGSANMSPYRNRPSSSTGPAPPVPAVTGGRPSTSQIPQRASGENWFGNTKLSVTLPPNEAARMVQELGQLLSVFAPPSPSTGPPGAKAPGSFRASKYVGGGSSSSTSGSNGGGSGGGSHKEAWGSGGGASDMGLGGSGAGTLLRPTSAASSTGSAKSMMAAFLGDGRHGHNTSANLSLMRLQQQQQQLVQQAHPQPPQYQQHQSSYHQHQQHPLQHQHQQHYQGQGMYGTANAAGMLASSSSTGLGGQQYPQHLQQHQQQQAHMAAGTGPMPQGAPATSPLLHTSYVTFQGGTYQVVGIGGGSGGSATPPQPPRLNLTMVGSGSPASSPKEPPAAGSTTSPGASPNASPHGPAPYPPAHGFPQPYPHAPSGPPPSRPWDSGHSLAYPQPPSAHGPLYGNASTAAGPGGHAAPSQMLSPRPSGVISLSGTHHLPSVDGTPASAAASVSGVTAGYTTMTVAATGTTTPTPPPYGQSASFSAGHSVAQGYGGGGGAAALSLTSAMAAPTVMGHSAHPPPPLLPVPTAAGPVPLAPPSSLAPSPHSAPLHLPGPAAAAASSGAAATTYPPAAAKAMRESLMPTALGNSSSGSVSSPSSSSSQVQPAPPASAFAAAASASPPAPSPQLQPQPPTSLAAMRSSSLANAPHPVGLPPPSPLKIAPPAAGAPGSARGAFIRSNSSRSSNGSGCDTVPYYNSVLATVQDSEREDDGSGSSGGAGGVDRQSLQTPTRAGYGSSGDGAVPSAPASASTPTSGVGYGGGQSGGGGSATITTNGACGTVSGSGSHVTWGGVVTQTSVPTTPIRVLHMSYNDLSARRASSSSQTGALEVGSPFARGVEGYSRALMENGTLTCVRPSTVPSNFAADSQPDLSSYTAEVQGSALAGANSDAQGSGTVVYGGSGSSAAVATSTSTVGPSWTPSSLATAMSCGQNAGPTATAAAAAEAQQQPQQQGASNPHQSTYHHQQQQQQTQTASTVAAAAAGYGTSREDATWGRSRDTTPARSFGPALTPAQQQQQQAASQQQNAMEAVAASTAAAAAAMAAASAAAAAVRQAAAAAAEAHSGATTPRTRERERETTTTATASSAAGTTSTAPQQHQPQSSSLSAAAAAASSSTPSAAASAVPPVPLPGDQPLRPKTSAAPFSPRFSPWGDIGTTTATTTTAKPHTPTPAPSPATPPTSAASASGTAPNSSPTTAASSSPAASSAAGSAVSSGSTSSGTVGSGLTAGGSAAGSAGSSSTGGSAPHAGSARRMGSIVARFNPVVVLGSEPDPTFGNLLPGYSVGKVIGEGGFCQVRLAVHHLSQRKVAVKVIDRTKLVDPNEAKRMQREIRVMKHLSHQCVIKLFEVVESPRHLFLVMEHAPSGSLLDYVRARKRLPEADACLFFQQIVASLEYCHSREVVHRDIKLENILLDADQRMKLIDFGLSAFFVPGKRLRVHCGSPSYAAPEIVARKAYEGPPVDVWSLGVVLFAMVAGYLPFHASGGNKQELCNKIIAGQYTAPEWLSSSMKDLLARMLTTDPEKRITFSQVWQHSWVRNGPQWHERGVNCYEVLADPSAPGGLRCDEQVVAELEAAGFSRSALAQYLAAGEANHLTASYFLLCEAKADALRRMRGSASAPRGRSGSSSSSSSSAVRSSTPVVSSSGGAHGSVQLAVTVAKARPGESPMRGTSSGSRPSTAMSGGGGGGGDRYASARGHHRSSHQAEDMAISAAGRMAVAV